MKKSKLAGVFLLVLSLSAAVSANDKQIKKVQFCEEYPLICTFIGISNGGGKEPPTSPNRIGNGGGKEPPKRPTRE